MDSDQLAKVNAESIAAFNSDYGDDLAAARRNHEDVIKKLQTILLDGKIEKPRRSILTRQVKYHRQRVLLLTAKQSTDANAPLLLLPTAESASRELLQGQGTVPISLIQLGLGLPRNSPQDESQTNALRDIAHALSDSPDLYTSQLPALPPTVYEVSFSMEMNGIFGGHYLHMKAKDPLSKQTLYIWRAHKRHRYQIPFAELYRAAEHGGSPALSIVINPVKTATKAAGSYGRNLTITSRLGTTIESMDRQEKLHWWPRRFTYGGKQFVWKKNQGGIFDGMHNELWEVKKVWPKPGSKTGKMLDEVASERLAWWDARPRNRSLGRVFFKAGIDQLFREQLLASLFTQACVSSHGHH